MASSSLTSPTPTSLLHCLHNGKLDILKYYKYCKSKTRALNLRQSLDKIIKSSKMKSAPCIKKKDFHQRIQKHILLVRDNNGKLCEFKPTDTLWYLMYIKEPPRNNHFLKKNTITI